MAFELTDFFRSYVPRGELRGLFNVARSDEDNDQPRYYAFLNESGSYVIQAVTTSGTLDNKVYSYFASKRYETLATNWTNRGSLSYVDYHLLFNQE